MNVDENVNDILDELNNICNELYDTNKDLNKALQRICECDELQSVIEIAKNVLSAHEDYIDSPEKKQIRLYQKLEIGRAK